MKTLILDYSISEFLTELAVLYSATKTKVAELAANHSFRALKC